MFLLAKYGVQTSFTFPVIKRAVVDLAVGADWTPATGDTKASKDGGNVANTTNSPSAVGGTGSALWTLTLTAAELTAAEVDVQIIDAATKAIEDQVIKVYTYGHASAKIPLDLSISQTGDSFSRLGAAGAGLTALGDTRLGNLDAAVSSRLATSGYTTPPTVIQIRQEMDSNSTKLAAAALEASVQSLITTANAINSKTTNLPSDPADESLLEAAISSAQTAITSAISALNNLSQLGVRTALGMASANMDTQLSSINTKTTNLPSDPADESLIEAAITAAVSTISSLIADKTGYELSASGVDAILDEVVEGAVTLRQSIRLANAANAGKTSGMGTSAVNIRDLGDSKNRVVATVDTTGNRSLVTTDLS